jgi:hypothetical protein
MLIEAGLIPHRNQMGVEPDRGRDTEDVVVFLQTRITSVLISNPSKRENIKEKELTTFNGCL